MFVYYIISLYDHLIDFSSNQKSAIKNTLQKYIENCSKIFCLFIIHYYLFLFIIIYTLLYVICNFLICMFKIFVLYVLYKICETL